jgi:hypothetical protein
MAEKIPREKRSIEGMPLATSWAAHEWTLTPRRDRIVVFITCKSMKAFHPFAAA